MASKSPPGEVKPIDPQVTAAVEKLSPAEAAAVLEVLEKAMKRRKIQLWGYLVAAVVMVVGTLGALVWYGSQEEGTFVGWAFLLPLGLCGLVVFVFGKWSERYRTAVEDHFEAEKRTKKP